MQILIAAEMDRLYAEKAEDEEGRIMYRCCHKSAGVGPKVEGGQRAFLSFILRKAFSG